MFPSWGFPLVIDLPAAIHTHKVSFGVGALMHQVTAIVTTSTERIVEKHHIYMHWVNAIFEHAELSFFF